jgi:integrase
VVVKAEGKVNFASLHDLRRTFGSRWAKLVKPAVLMRLMRHENIQTTMAYYVDLDCDEIAEDLWQSSAVSVPLAPAGEGCGGREK